VFQNCHGLSNRYIVEIDIPQIIKLVLEEEFKNTKGVIIIHKSKKNSFPEG
jgi:hypothetical protein